MAEEKRKDDEKRQKQRAREYTEEQEYWRNMELVHSTSHGEEKVALSKEAQQHALQFMYAPPPGLKLEPKPSAQPLMTREEEKFKERKDHFAGLLKNAPTEGKYTENLNVNYKPLGIELRHVRCTRCGAWGHTGIDRECPLRDFNPKDAERQQHEDPMAAIAKQQHQQSAVVPAAAATVTASAAAPVTLAHPQPQLQPLAMIIPTSATVALSEKLLLKTGEWGPTGSGENQVLVPSDEESDPEKIFMASLTKKQKKLLLKRFQEDNGETSPKHKHHKHHKHEDDTKHRHKHGKHEKASDSSEGDDKRKRHAAGDGEEQSPRKRQRKG
eukprot:TRINITY_DN17250_c0_g1_i1.p1 TRINITY_DN17250_c0_g1~~TRINITY_DN17250_c0_g1_i1.p1  ORF type:complete len:367 (-),score=132.44 TRINITY_DN17250_c0_g1_i1:82-1062(-)